MKARLSVLIVFLCLASYMASAQDLIVPKSGDPFKAYNLEISGKYYFYTTEAGDDAQIQRIAKDDVLMVRRADGTVVGAEVQSAATEPEPVASNYPVINESDIHGSLIAKGNKVFIPTNSVLAYERAGQERLKELVKEWGYWTVVDKLEQAHFVLQFRTEITGIDQSYLWIRPRKYYVAHPNVCISDVQATSKSKGMSMVASTNANPNYGGMLVNLCKSSEDVDENKFNASKLFENMKRMVSDQTYSLYKYFYKTANRFLDADAPSNTPTGWKWQIVK